MQEKARHFAEVAMRAGLVERPARTGTRGLPPMPAMVDIPEPDVLRPETIREVVGKFDLTTASGRSALQHTLMELHLEGRLSDRSLDALNGMIKTASKDQPADAGRRTLQVRFELITSRAEAEQYTEAQDLRGGLH